MKLISTRVLLLALQSTLLFSAAPQVSKVEPPHWWAGHSINPVRLLVRGANLDGAHVQTATPGFDVGRITTNASGTYLFVDLLIPANAHPGAVSLTITTHDGSTRIPFEVHEPLPRQGRFQGFSSDDVMYLIMPDRFANGDTSNDDPPRSKGLYDRKKRRFYHGGDLQGIIDHLPYLQDLGITALWLNPVYDNNDKVNERERYDNEAVTDYHGYGAIDFYAVDEHLGDIAKFRQLVDAAHQHGIKVIQDQVANHTGPYHPWVKDPPTPTWFNGTEQRHLRNTWQTWTLMDPYASPQVQRETLDGWFINILPDLNQDDEETKRYLIQNTLWWIGTVGLDGVRQDTLPYVPRRFWRDWMAAIKREYPDFRVVGEMLDGDPALVSFFQGGRARFDGIDTGVDSLFDFPLYFTLRHVFTEGKPIRDVASMLAHDRLYPDPAMLVTFVGLHDVSRFMNERGATIARMKLAFACLLTTRGIPLIYYGDEIAMPGGNDPDNRRDFPGGWKEDSRNAFEAAGRTSEQQSLFEFVRRLTALRKELPELRHAPARNLVVNQQSWAFTRGSVLVVLNNDNIPSDVEFQFAQSGTWPDRLGGPPLTSVAGKAHVLLPPQSIVIYKTR